MHRPGRAPADGELRLEDVAGELLVPEAATSVLVRTARALDGACGQRSVALFGFLDHAIGIDVTHDRQNGIPGVVIRPIEPLDRFGGERAQHRFAPDAPATNAMPVV